MKKGVITVMKQSEKETNYWCRMANDIMTLSKMQTSWGWRAK